MHDDNRLVSRRAFVIGGATLAGGVGVLTLEARETRAEISMGALNVSGDDASLAEPPSSVLLTVSGSWQIDGPTPEQARVIAQIEKSGEAEDMAEHVETETPASGDYTLEAELLDHRHIDGADLLPDEVGAEKATEFVLRIILLAVNDGSIAAETVIEDTAAVRLTREGLKLAVSGDGSLVVTA